MAILQFSFGRDKSKNTILSNSKDYQIFNSNKETLKDKKHRFNILSALNIKIDIRKAKEYPSEIKYLSMQMNTKKIPELSPT